MPWVCLHLEAYDGLGGRLRTHHRDKISQLAQSPQGSHRKKLLTKGCLCCKIAELLPYPDLDNVVARK